MTICPAQAGAELRTAGLRRDRAQMYADVVDQHARFDQLAARVARIEGRVDLLEARAD